MLTSKTGEGAVKPTHDHFVVCNIPFTVTVFLQPFLPSFFPCEDLCTAPSEGIVTLCTEVKTPSPVIERGSNTKNAPVPFSTDDAFVLRLPCLTNH